MTIETLSFFSISFTILFIIIIIIIITSKE